MSECCIDASVIIKLAIKGEEHWKLARRLVEDCLTHGTTLIASPIFPFEIDTAVQKRVFEGRLNAEDASRVYRALDRIDVHVVDHPQLRQRSREIAARFNQRAVYDSSYAALAELHGCEFWTADQKFFDAVKSSLKFVKHLRDYPMKGLS